MVIDILHCEVKGGPCIHYEHEGTDLLILNKRAPLLFTINLMKPDSLASIMNWSKNLYVFMLGAIIVFSGCFGTGTTDGEDGDADDGTSAGTTVVNNYYNNTTTSNNTTVSNGTQANPLWYVSGTTNHQCIPVFNANVTSGYCINNDNNMSDVWVIVQNYTVINQSANTGIHIHSYSAGQTAYSPRIGTVCSNGAISGWGLNSDDGDYYDNSFSASYDEGLLPYAGLDCNHYLFAQHPYDTSLTVHWHVAYEVVNLLPGPH